MEPSTTRRVKAVGFVAATIIGLVAIQFIYEWLMPAQLRAGQLWASSFNPFTYPIAYWFTHLMLTSFLLGGIAWTFKLRGARLLGYLLLMYFTSLLGPIWMAIVEIYLLPAKRPY